MQDLTERTFRGTLTGRDVKRHIPHVFQVPEGATRVRATLGFDPAIVAGHRNMICLSLYDPCTFRGARHRHGNRHAAEICHDSATPGFLPGPLPAGDWVVQLETHMVMPGEACTYRIAVAVDHAEVPAAGGGAPPEPCFDTIEDARSGWYLGDLHAHSVHSDGAWEVADLVAAARTRGLDFVTLTDHNTTGGLAEMARSRRRRQEGAQQARLDRPLRPRDRRAGAQASTRDLGKAAAAPIRPRSAPRPAACLRWPTPSTTTWPPIRTARTHQRALRYEAKRYLGDWFAAPSTASPAGTSRRASTPSPPITDGRPPTGRCRCCARSTAAPASTMTGCAARSISGLPAGASSTARRGARSRRRRRCCPAGAQASRPRSTTGRSATPSGSGSTPACAAKRC